jgi:hypothetical protein
MYVLSRTYYGDDKLYIIGVYSSRDKLFNAIATSFPDTVSVIVRWDEVNTPDVIYLSIGNYLFIDVTPLDEPNITV